MKSNDTIFKFMPGTYYRNMGNLRQSESMFPGHVSVQQDGIQLVSKVNKGMRMRLDSNCSKIARINRILAQFAAQLTFLPV